MDENDWVDELVTNYAKGARDEFLARWKVWPIDLQNPGPSEVTIGLLHRQYILAVNIVGNPGTWSIDIAPILLRSMVEVYIWLSWILVAPVERSMKFIDDGLGKEKLVIKHRTDEIEAMGLNPEDDWMLNVSKAWIEDHRYSFLIDVNLSGSWSGLDMRKMAEEADCRDFYRFTYPSFSSTVHSTWNHVGKVDLIPCQNPLHGGHRVPREEAIPLSVDFPLLAAKYLDKTFALLDKQLNLSIDVESTFERLFVEREEEASNEA
ncbi:MAG: hypothetical protein CVU68_05155 [Deltaproteobacteria bacterium HGW-Deltaproteobacteria-3]|jgi:hypothetical protein|nr:MAG: hypothetical protein CVU68_05155 [Deltaproteobacteria bacterium HGW-Deltaproteobacteria-3]